MSENSDLEDSVDFFMPSGEDVLALLNQAGISDSFLRGLLRERGVFLNTADHGKIVEQFVLTYLSPSEYSAIVERLEEKEEALKLKTYTYKIKVSNLNLSDIVPTPSKLVVHEVARDRMGNYEIEGGPSFSRVSDSEYAMDFAIKRKLLSKNWIKSQERFEGRMELKHAPGDEHLTVRVFHSSNETKEVSNYVRKWLRDDLRERKITKKNSEKVIEFGDFSHSQRMTFLMQFTQSFEGENFEFARVTDFDFSVDDKKIPAGEQRLIWMKGEVSKSSLKGKNLKEIFVLSEKKAWEYIELWSIELKFNFSSGGIEGNFCLNLEFDGYGATKSPKSKFQTSVGRVSSRKYTGSTDELRRDFHRRINQYIGSFAEAALSGV